MHKNKTGEGREEEKMRKRKILWWKELIMKKLKVCPKIEKKEKQS